MDRISKNRLRTLSARKLARVAGVRVMRAVYAFIFPFAYFGALLFEKYKGKRYRFGAINLSLFGGSLPSGLPLLQVLV